MPTALRSSGLAVLLIVAGVAGACDRSIVVVDGFGDGDVDGDRLHTYAAGGRVDFVLSGDVLQPDSIVTSSDEDVFRVDSVESQPVPGIFGPDGTALTVVATGVGAGTAELVAKSAGGDVIATRTLTFVDVDGVLFRRGIGLPGPVESPVDPAGLAIGARGAGFYVRFTAGEEDDVQGRGVIEFADREHATVEVQKTIGLTVITSRNYVQLKPVAAPTRLPFSLAGQAGEHELLLLPGVASTLDFVRKDELRARLGEDEADTELAGVIAAGGDERVLCDDDRCAVKVEPKDAEGRVIFGAAVDWTLPGEEQPLPGDIFTFKPGDEEITVRAVLGELDQTLTVRVAPDSLSVANSTDISSCASLGHGGSAVVLFGLLALGRRRRRHTGARSLKGHGPM